MTKLAMSEAPAATTPRLVFDEELDENEIPQFLRKNKKPDYVDPEQAEDARVIRDGGASEAVVQEPTGEAQEPMTETHVENDVTTDISDNITSDEASGAIEGYSEDDVPISNDNDDSSEPVNLDQMSVEELQRQQAEIDRKIQEKREAEKKAVIAQIVEVVNTYKIPLDELVEALGGLKVKRKGVKAVQKYRDPKTGQTWSGRGKEPTWIRGKDRKKFEIA